MSPEEAESIFDTMFPIGKERWIKLKYLDRDKVMDAFRMDGHTPKGAKHSEEIGYEVTAIGCRDEYTPQINAMMEVRDDIINMFYGKLDEYEINNMRAIFKNKMDMLKEQTIVYVSPKG